MLDCPRAAGGAHAVGARRILDQHAQGIGERIRRRRAQEAGDAVDDGLGRAAAVGSDNGSAGGHRLDRDVAEVLERRRVDQRAGTAEQLAKRGVVGRADDLDAVGEAERLRPCGQRGAGLGALAHARVESAGDDQAQRREGLRRHPRAQRGHRIDREAEILDRRPAG